MHLLYMTYHDACGSLLPFLLFFFFQAEDGIRDLVRSRGLGDVYKRQAALLAGIPDTVTAVTVNRVCISGMEAVLSGAAMIQAGMAVSYTHLTLPTIYSV